MKSLIFTLIAFVLGSTFVYAQDAAAIIERSRNRIQSETVSTRFRMTIRGRGESVSERQMDQYSKKDNSGNNRSVIVFGEPATVRGTRFLTIENQSGPNEQWIFLPSLGRVRRIAAAEGSSSFVGTDFSYDDLASTDRRTNLDNHSIIREEILNNRACYVIESIPIDTAYQYSRMIQWIDRENYVPHKVELYDRRGNLTKLLEIIDLREVQGRLTPTVTRMTSLSAGTSTTLNVVNLIYDDPIPESVFTTNFLETGRP